MENELSIGSILSKAWDSYTSHFQLFLAIILSIYVPINLVLSFLPNEASMENFMMQWRVIQALEGLIGIIATMAIAYAVKNILDKKEITFGQALTKSASRWGAAIGTGIILGFCLLGLTLLLIIPGIIFYIYWMFSIFVVVLMDKSGKDAMDYSKSLVKGRWWQVFGYTVLFSLLGIIVGVFASIPFLFMPEGIVTTFIDNMVFDILMAYFTIVSVVFFLELDATKQGDMPEPMPVG